MHDSEHNDLPDDDHIEISDLDPPTQRETSLAYRISQYARKIHLSPQTRIRLSILAILLGGSVIAYQFLPSSHPKTTVVASVSAQTMTLTQGASATNISVANNIAYIFTDDGTLIAKRASDGKLLWSSKVSISPLPPIIVDNIIFLTSQNSKGSHVDAFRASDGTLQWSFQTQSLAPQPLLVKNGMVYVLTHTGTVYALHESTGNLLWQFATGETTYQTTDVLSTSNGVAAMRTNKQIVYLLRTQNGSRLWQYTINPPETPASWYPDIEGNIAYIRTKDNSLQAHRLNDGQFLWQYTANEDLWSSKTQNGVVYVYSQKNSSLKALVGLASSLLWQQNGISYWNVQQPGLVFVRQTNGLLEALQARDGSLLWQFKLPTTGNILWLSSTTNGLLYVGTNTPDMAIFALRITTGSLLWQHILNNSYLNSQPNITSNALYMLQSDGSFDVWRADDGRPLWHYQLTTTPIAQGPTEVGSLVYILREDGTINVLRAQDGKVAWSYSLLGNP